MAIGARAIGSFAIGSQPSSAGVYTAAPSALRLLLRLEDEDAALSPRRWSPVEYQASTAPGARRLIPTVVEDDPPIIGKEAKP